MTKTSAKIRIAILRGKIAKLPLIGLVAHLLGNIERYFKLKYQQIRLPKLRIYEEFPLFAPNSAGTPSQKTVLTSLAITTTFENINKLVNEFEFNKDDEVQSIEDFLEVEKFNLNLAEYLGELFNKHGSDKANPNNYYLLYSYLLRKADSIHSLLEIGLGSRDLRVVSNMGLFGKPGASLRAFKEYLPQAQIFGADIDKGALFQEERIKTFWVDQTEHSTLNDLFSTINHGFDLIIDDGLHSPNANILTLIAAVPHLRPGGTLVIEDISPESRSIWKVVSRLIPNDSYNCVMLAGRNADIFMVTSL